MENNEISFNLFDNMIHNEPMRWQSIECDLKDNTFFLHHLNNYIKHNPIHELFVDEVPEEYEYLFEDCTIEELTDIRDELLVCMN
jgi:hypothetical protein